VLMFKQVDEHRHGQRQRGGKPGHLVTTRTRTRLRRRSRSSSCHGRYPPRRPADKPGGPCCLPGRGGTKTALAVFSEHGPRRRLPKKDSPAATTQPGGHRRQYLRGRPSGDARRFAVAAVNGGGRVDQHPGSSGSARPWGSNRSLLNDVEAMAVAVPISSELHVRWAKARAVPSPSSPLGRARRGVPDLGRVALPRAPRKAVTSILGRDPAKRSCSHLQGRWGRVSYGASAPAGASRSL
jgi:hypothetical protein